MVQGGLMQLTKYEHACFTVEKDNQLLVVDPGEWSSDFISPSNVVAIVITHDHSDHFDHEQLAAIIDENPEAVIVAPETVTSKIEVFHTKTVQPGDTFDIGPFHLEFFGGKHASIHPSIPQTANVGVLINDLLYYPGDSLTLPGRSVDTLALPVAAPWLKISESMDFLMQIRPRLAFPTHDAVLSNIGKELIDGRLTATGNEVGSIYQRLTESITV
jgi:L-ascorbate metabolism protein UlaG (beta-lactamase superfamily)